MLFRCRRLSASLTNMRRIAHCTPILGAFAKLRKATITFVMYVSLSVYVEQLGSPWTYFH
jgi:hypothetical protein